MNAEDIFDFFEQAMGGGGGRGGDRGQTRRDAYDRAGILLINYLFIY